MFEHEDSNNQRIRHFLFSLQQLLRHVNLRSQRQHLCKVEICACIVQYYISPSVLLPLTDGPHIFVSYRLCLFKTQPLSIPFSLLGNPSCSCGQVHPARAHELSYENKTEALHCFNIFGSRNVYLSYAMFISSSSFCNIAGLRCKQADKGLLPFMQLNLTTIL